MNSSTTSIPVAVVDPGAIDLPPTEPIDISYLLV
jgi:hypothetical protein